MEHDPIDLSVDRESEVPLGTQLIWKLRTLIATGALAPGLRLPGIREVAEAAGVNVNTVRSVFARLEEQGLLASEQGRGTFVAPDASSDPPLAEATEAAIVRARASGVDLRELAAALYVTARTPPAVPRRGREAPDAARGPEAHTERRALYEQIDHLERELSRLNPLGTLEERRGASAPRILTAAELKGIRDELANRLEHLRREREGWRAESLPQGGELGAQQAAVPAARSRRWRRAGAFTGRPAAGVSWTAG